MTSPAPAATPVPPPAPSGTPRWVWVLLILLTAALVAVTAGLLAHAGGASIPNAILTGGAAFAGATGLLLGLAHFGAGGRG
ncbi:hypothetical protein ACQP2Y_46880 (plasmid) [Actinoplanes sp. CA-051413]|uniref:hypothetical protein n=1 Tax=Actinoplanes sp. CA-051413 TaxID=3239899 RepID=UPI003D96D264